jgi:hypothetical protein
LNEFLDITTFNDWILPTYYFAHIVISFGILNRGKRQADVVSERLAATA